jgi:DNA-directed RNA polymerase subunit RPC12/RpoP
MESATGARSLRCERCAAAFSLEQPLAGGACPFCGHRQRAKDGTDARRRAGARGNPDYNLELSVSRAEAVRDRLAEKGLDPQLMQVSGMGSNLPLAPEIHLDGSDNPEARARNRRVDILLLPAVPGVQIG